MQKKANQIDTENHNSDMDEELADVLDCQH